MLSVNMTKSEKVGRWVMGVGCWVLKIKIRSKESSS